MVLSHLIIFHLIRALSNVRNTRPWFLRLFLTFLLLDSQKTAMHDIRNKISVDQIYTGSANINDNYSNKCTNSGGLYTGKAKTFSVEITTTPFATVSSIQEETLDEKSKQRQFITHSPAIRHHKMFPRLWRRVNSFENKDNLVGFPRQVKSFEKMNSSLGLVLGEPKDTHKTENGPRKTKAAWNHLSFVRHLFAEIKNYTSLSHEEVLEILQYLQDGGVAKYGRKDYRINSSPVRYVTIGSGPLKSRYAYFSHDLKVKSHDNSVDTYIDCFFPHDICRAPNHVLQRNSRRRKTCSCDEGCEDYGNCCIDHDFRRTNVETMHNVHHLCVRTRSHFGYYAVSTCPSLWENEYVRSFCENVKNDESDVLLQVPVSSKDTYVTYSNVYCAFCNGDTNAEFWTVETRCADSDFYSVDRKFLKGNSNCSRSFSEPSYLLRNREHTSTPRVPYLLECHYDLVNQCPQHWMSQTWNQTAMEIAMKCRLIHAPVSSLGISSPEVPKYKNEFCAICNGISAVYLLCPVKMPRTTPPPTMIPMSVLLDMDFTTGGLIVGSQERCPHMHLYDPWKEECRSVVCNQHIDYKFGRCVPQIAYSDQLAERRQENQQLFNDSSFSDCLQAIFALDEISISENGTVIITYDGSVYQSVRYESINNDTVAVCIPSGTYSLYASTFTSFQGYLSIVGMSISVVFLLIRIVLSIFFPERHKLPPKIVLFLSVTLFFSQMLFIFGIHQTGNHIVCVVIGMFMHYGFLSSFFWTNVLAYDIWKTFGSSQMKAKSHFTKKQLLFYSLYGWISPLFVVALAAAFDSIAPYELLKPRYGKSLCWISNKSALAAFFGVPLAILLVLNTIFFFITSLEIRRTTKATKFVHDTCSRAKNRARFGLYCKLAFIMGLTWVFGFVAAFSGSSVLWYFFIAFNSIQGIYIFVAFTHFRIPSNSVAKKSSQWTFSGNSTTSRSSTTATVPRAKI